MLVAYIMLAGGREWGRVGGRVREGEWGTVGNSGGQWGTMGDSGGDNGG